MAREPDVALLMTACGSLDICLTRFYEWNIFCNFSSTRLQNHQQHHAALEVALTVRSMLLKRKFWHLPLFKIVGFAFENRSTIHSYFDFGLKNSSFRLPYQRHSSSADCARELFKGSNGSANLVDCTRKKTFWLGGADFLWLTS